MLTRQKRLLTIVGTAERGLLVPLEQAGESSGAKKLFQVEVAGPRVKAALKNKEW